MFQDRQRIRLFVKASILMTMALVLGACSTLFSVGASAPNTSVATETESSPQDSPIHPTQTPLPGRGTYTKDTYGFGFNYPDNWILEEEDHAVVLKQDAQTLRINYAWETEDIGPGLFGRTGIGAGDFIYAGKVDFLGELIPVDALVHEGKTKGLFYNQGRLIEVGDLVFMIVLEQVGEDYGAMDISEKQQAEASSIVESFTRLDWEAKCLEQGGRWDMLGLSGPGCNLPTEDGGKTCSDWSDCESLCLADDDTLYNEDETGFLQPDHEIIEQRNAENDQFSGVCSAWQSNFGCHVVLEKGKYVVMCID